MVNVARTPATLRVTWRHGSIAVLDARSPIGTAAPGGRSDRAEPRQRQRKERTRQAILDAALELADAESLATVSLRQVAKAVGIVPTAFYRHFASLDELGLALVDQSFASLREMLRDVRRRRPSCRASIDRSVDVLVEHVHQRREHFRFVARERTSGPPVVREAIRHELELFERELATDLARLPNAHDAGRPTTCGSWRT